MSATRAVPTSVPSLLHSSRPPAGSVATKNILSANTVNSSGVLLVDPG
jgi:hypothetical protein